MAVQYRCAVLAAQSCNPVTNLVSPSVFDFQARTDTHASRRKQRQGVVAVEVALLAPLLILFVFGMVEFGRMVMVKQSMTNAAREGCRVAVLATTTNPNDVNDTVHNYLDTMMPNSDVVRITSPVVLADIASGTDLTVAVEVDFADVSWLPTAYLGFNPTIGAEARQKRE